MVFMLVPGLGSWRRRIRLWRECFRQAMAGDFRGGGLRWGHPSWFSGAPQGDAIAFVARLVIATLQAGRDEFGEVGAVAQELLVVDFFASILTR